MRFRGYSLDDAGYPTFQHDIIADDGAIISISQQPQPVISNSQIALVDRIELNGPPGRQIVANFAGMKLIP